MELKRVVVTGLGAITPVGNSVPEFWENIVNGVSGAGPITHFDASQFKTQFACEVKNFDVTKYIDRKEARKMDLYTQYAVAVAKEAAGRGVAQTFLQGLIEGEKGPDFRCDTHPDNKVMQHLLEKLGFHYCGKVPIDGVRLAYQKIKRKAETSLFQVISEDDRWDYRAEQSQND